MQNRNLEWYKQAALDYGIHIPMSIRDKLSWTYLAILVKPGTYDENTARKMLKRAFGQPVLPDPTDATRKQRVKFSEAAIARQKRLLAKNLRRKPRQRGYITYMLSGVDVLAPQFLRSFQWRKVRMEALKIHGGRCQCCGASPKDGTTILNVDHIKPRKTHPQLALDVGNLQVLCDSCNHGKGNWDETDWRE